MSSHEPPASERDVEVAIARVLAAEQAARSAIVQAQAEAAQIAEHARAAARALGERTQRRIERLRAAFERRADADVAELQAQTAALLKPHEPDADAGERIARAVTRLAARLTGGAV